MPVEAPADDLVSTNRGQSTQCAQKYRSHTEDGKRRSRQNAVRHGLCAETVIEIVEDADDYSGFEAAVIADYDAQTAVERELVLRLASLLWRLRRTTAIETDLLRIQAEILRDRQHRCESPDQSEQRQNVLYRVLDTAIPPVCVPTT